MHLSPDLRFQKRLIRRANFLAVIVLVIGVLVLVGWELDIDILKRMVPGLVAMNPVTATCMILSVISFFLLNKKKESRTSILLGYTLALFIIFIGGFKILDLIYDFNVKPDMFLFTEKIRSTVIYGRPNFMAPNTAVCLVLTGAALLFINIESKTKLLPFQLLAVLASFMGLLSILGYIYQVKSFYELPFFIPMALHTAICFFLVAAAILLSQPDKGIMKDFTSTLAGSITAKLLIPAAILLPTVLGFFRLYGDWAGFYSKEFGVAVFALSIIIVFLGLIWFNTVLLNKRDVQKRNSENALEASRQEIIYLGGLIEKTSDGIVSFDQSMNILTWNKGAELIYGYTLAEVKGKPSRSIFKSEYSKEQLDEWLHELNTTGTWTGKLKQSNKNGAVLYCLLSTTVLKNEFGKITGYLTVTKNITEKQKEEDKLKESEEQLKKANEEMEAFSYSVSHDLRAPLRSIVGFTTILEDDYTSKLDDEAKRLMGVIKRNTLKMAMLIDDLLAFSKLSRQSIQKTKVDTNELVRNVIAELDGKYDKDKIDWMVADLPQMYADLNSIRQVWVNLISNAVKYSSNQEKPQINIKAEKENGTAIFSVKDNGVGFDERSASKLFKVFQRLHGASEFEGTGVGLAIVEKIISKHAGKIWVKAELNKGAEFYFCLPDK